MEDFLTAVAVTDSDVAALALVDVMAALTAAVAEGGIAMTDSDAAAGTVTTSAKSVVTTKPERITIY